ncbi:MAG: phosphoglucosamine mutase [Eubacteriales bacterium]|nr:phosphoglucosamine mutase [Eubacteriales bacterium]
MGRLFGTDGVRGIANLELTAELAFKLGQAGAFVLTAETHHTPKILVGTDTRISNDMLEAALVAGICSVGAEAVCLGVISTPGVAYLTRYYGADAGAVISASHNPFEFNGIKFFNSSGYKLSDSIEDRIEEIINSGISNLPKPVNEKVGRKNRGEAAVSDYVNFLVSTSETDLAGFKIILDCANGAAFRAAPDVFRRLGAEVIVINDSPDGININSHCGSTHIDGLMGKVREIGADAGLAFDGDADRLLAVDEHGHLVDGDQIMAISALELKRRGELADDTIVITVMSNMGLEIMAGKHGLKVVKTKVGDRYVLEEMLKGGYSLGGEQSGHVIYLKHNTTGDGILTGIQLLGAVKRSGAKLSELAEVMQVLPQVLKNVKVPNDRKPDIDKDTAIQEMIRRVEGELDGTGRVLIRPSGTEPLVRVMLEGTDHEYITKKAAEIAELIEKRLGRD